MLGSERARVSLKISLDILYSEYLLKHFLPDFRLDLAHGNLISL